MQKLVLPKSGPGGPSVYTWMFPPDHLCTHRWSPQDHLRLSQMVPPRTWMVLPRPLMIQTWMVPGTIYVHHGWSTPMTLQVQGSAVSTHKIFSGMTVYCLHIPLHKASANTGEACCLSGWGEDFHNTQLSMTAFMKTILKVPVVQQSPKLFHVNLNHQQLCNLGKIGGEIVRGG